MTCTLCPAQEPVGFKIELNKMRFSRPYFACVSVLLFGCTNPSITNVNTSKAARAVRGPIYVSRFEGNPEFVDEATDMFVSGFERHGRQSVIQGGPNRKEGPELLRGSNIVQADEVIAAARKAGASLVVLGKVTSHHTAGTLNGFTTVRLYEVTTGQRVGTIHRPSGLLFGYSEHQCVMKSAERAARATAESLE